MTTIADIRLIPLRFDLPAGQSYGMARGLAPARQATIVEVVTRDGVTGIGEAWGPPKAVAAYLEVIKPFYVGQTLYKREHVLNEILGRFYHLGIQNEMLACISGINVASYDALGRTLGVSCADLLGGRARLTIPVYASDGYISNDPDNQLEHQLEAFADDGYPGCKIKIGLGPRSDAGRCALVRRHLGPDVLLMVDVNGNYTLDLTLASMRRTEAYDVHFYEEPLPPTDYEGYRLLSSRALVPVAAGEAHYTVHDFARLMRERSVDFVQPDLTLVGGFDEALKIRTLCQVQNVRYSPHCWGSAVGLAAALHFMAAYPDTPHTDCVPEPRLLEYDVSKNPLRDELLTEPLKPRNGTIAVPEGPGLGVTLDPEAIARFRID